MQCGNDTLLPDQAQKHAFFIIIFQKAKCTWGRGKAKVKASSIKHNMSHNFSPEIQTV